MTLRERLCMILLYITFEIQFVRSKGNHAHFLTKILHHAQHDMCCNSTIWRQRPQYDSYRALRRLFNINHATNKSGLD